MVEIDESVIREFMNISGASRENAQRSLRIYNGSLSRALDSFYAEHSQVDVSPATARPKRQKTAPPKTITTMKEIDNFYAVYESREDGRIDPQGISRLSSDLGIDPLDVVWLYIACECDAQTMGFFTKSEWERGMTAIGTGNVDALKGCVSEIRDTLGEDPAKFRKVYTFTFKFSLEPGTRNIPSETAIELWKLLLPFSGWALQDEWIRHVQDRSSHARNRAVTRDLWIQLLEFLNQYPDQASLSRFDPEGSAWPNLIDEFYEHLKTPNK